MVIDEQNVTRIQHTLVGNMNNHVSRGVRWSHLKQSHHGPTRGDLSLTGERLLGGRQVDAGEVEVTEETA